VQIEQFWRSMINLSSFIAFHARQTPQRCALKYRGEEMPMRLSTSDPNRRRLAGLTRDRPMTSSRC
jgi:fatty-acyl-CoA synthase